jgi:cellulose biosynthesis protein BcsQ
LTVPIIALFNNKGGVGKTSLAYHLAAMYADLEIRVVVADFDPQANLTSMFLDEDRLEELWPEGEHEQTVYGAIRPLIAGTGDVIDPCPTVDVEENVRLIAGDLLLGGFEDDLSQVWPDCLDGKERAFRVISAFFRMVRSAVEAFDADLAIVDVGPNLGAINRAALVGASHVVVPVAPDLFSLQGLRNLGPTLRRWQAEWRARAERRPATLPASVSLPDVGMEPVGYVVLQHAIRLDRPTLAYGKWAARIPGAYAKYVLEAETDVQDPAQDPFCLASLKHYRSLMPMAQEARKPIFRLKPADGALGSHMQAAIAAGRDFAALAREIAGRTGVAIPDRYGEQRP